MDIKSNPSSSSASVNIMNGIDAAEDASDIVSN